MLQPEHLRSFQATRSTTRRAVSIGFVALFHVIVIYAFYSGLANQLIQKLPEEIKVEVVKEKPPEVKPPPPPPPDLQKPPPPFVPPPEIVIQNEAPVQSTITVQHNVQVPQAPPKPPGITAPALISGAAKCNTQYYPPIAIRLNQEGTVTLSVHIDTEGSVTGAEITNSSGHDSLDQAGIKCVTNAWHFKPAMQNGAPVATVRQYAIKFVLSGG